MNHPWSPFDSRILHHRKCLPGLGPQLRLRDYDSVHLPIQFLFLTSGPGDSCIACATPATVDRALIWHRCWQATLISSSPSTQMAAACTSVICTESQSLKPFLSPALAWCLHLSPCDQWQPFTMEYIPLTAVPSPVYTPRQQEAMGCRMWVLEDHFPCRYSTETSRNLRDGVKPLSGPKPATPPWGLQGLLASLRTWSSISLVVHLGCRFCLFPFDLKFWPQTREFAV